jgi:UDP-glucose 4-epimerase
LQIRPHPTVLELPPYSRSLLAQHHDVVIIDNLATGRRENIEHLLDHPRVTFIEGSITDLDLLMETFPGADGIFHQAAIPSVPRSVKDPLASNEANVTGTLDVLVAAKDCETSGTTGEP